MDYWTNLVVVVLDPALVDYVFTVVYKSFEDCAAGLVAVSDTLGYDHRLYCEATTVASGSVTPRPRPW